MKNIIRFFIEIFSLLGFTTLFFSQNTQEYDQKLAMSLKEGKFDFQNIKKNLYLFSSNKNHNLSYYLITSNLYKWQNSSWIDSTKTTNTYYPSGTKKEILVQIYQGEQSINSSRTTFNVDNNGSIIEKLYQIWKLGRWENSYRETYTFDDKNNISISILQAWKNNQWSDSSRTLYTYNQYGQVIRERDEEKLFGLWIEMASLFCVYNTKGYVIEKDYQILFGLFEFKEIYTYDNKGNNIEIITYELENSSWIQTYKMINTFDANNFLTITTKLTKKNNQWVNWEKSIYTNDANGNNTELIIQQWQVNQWVNFLKYVNTFGNITAVSNEEQKIQPEYLLFQNYPNPFNPSTVISYQLPVNSYVSLKIYNSLGQEIQTLVDRQQQAGNYDIEWAPGSAYSGLPSGVYYYRLKTDKYCETKKMLYIK